MKKEQRDQLYKYRDKLIDLEVETMISYDKTLITLSTSSIGLTFIFLKDILRPIIDSYFLLMLSWIMWAFCLLLILFSFYISSLAYKYTIKQVDDGSIYNSVPGGQYSKLVRILSPIGGISYLCGVILFIIFISKNLGG